MHRTYIIEALFVILGIALLIAVIKYPKDAFVKIPLGFLHTVFVRPFANAISIILDIVNAVGPKRAKTTTRKVSDFLQLDDGEPDRPYPASSMLKIDFASGDKHVFIANAKGDIKYLTEDFLGALTGTHSIDDFAVRNNGSQCMVTFPKAINFYDFFMLVMHLNGKHDEKNCIGIFKSAKVDFYVYLDPATLNNLLGVTNTGKKFSIHMLEDDMDNELQLKLNQDLNVDLPWIKQWVGKI